MRNHKPLIMPHTRQILEQVGMQIRLARLRRQLSIELVAERATVSRTTVWKIEKGSPEVSMGAYANVLKALGGMDKELLKICKDDVLGRTLQDLGLPERIRAPRRKKDED